MLPVHLRTVRFLRIYQAIIITFAISLSTCGPSFSHPVEPELENFDTAAVLEILVDDRLVGTGWFVSPGGLAITAAHNLKQAKKIEVITKSNGRLTAKPIAKDLAHDLALLKVERPAGFFPYLQTSQASLRLGQKLYSFGSALYRHNLYFSGEIANKQIQYEWNENNHCYTEVYYLSAMTPKGLSGAPWVNQAGEVVAIQSGMINWKDALMGIAFITPAAAVDRLMKSKKNLQFRALGATVAESWENPQAALQTKNHEGILVTRVISGGLAEQSGLKKGDFITEINGQKVLYRNQLLRSMRQAGLTQHIELKVFNNYQSKKIILK